MQTIRYNDYSICIREMSRKSQLSISQWFRGWIADLSSDITKLQTVTEISTQVILHSHITLYRNDVRLTDGTYDLEEGVRFTLPLTAECLNDLPVSLAADMIDAAGKENSFVLASFLAGTRALLTRQMKTFERRSDSGLLTKPLAH